MSEGQSKAFVWSTVSRRRRITRVFRILVAMIAISFAIFPVIWVFSAALNPTGSLATQRLIPENASLRNLDELLNDPLHPFARWLWNSIKISSITAILSVFVISLSAYAFSRFRFRFRRSLLLSVFLVQAFPSSMTIVGLFLLMQQIGRYLPTFGLNSHGGLILIYLGWVMGVNTWLMKGFFDTIPRDIDESAMVDGASHWQIFWHLILPLVRPILAVITILSFIYAFNDFIIARTILQTSKEFTLMVGMYLFVDQQFAQNWGVFAAGALIASVPIILIYLFLQDQIVGGLTQGAIKG